VTLPMNADIQALQTALRSFAQEREWEQFHSPKNLAAALSVEASELLEHFQWLTEEQSRSLADTKRNAIAEEIADVLLYLLRLADKLDIDPIDAARKKLAINAIKYPVDLAKGTSKKYSEF
jgi:NTP pyrophosphatase (non-canonical NTP hydrolase)